MKFFHTLRFKLTVLYLLLIVTPFIISAFALPYYVQGLLLKEARLLTGSTLTALSRVIEIYLDDLDRLSISPYLSDEVMTALKLKASRLYEEGADPYTKLVTDRALLGTLPQTLTNTRSDILNMIIIPKSGSAYLTSKDNQIELVEDFPFQEQAWYTQAVQHDGRSVFVSAHKQNYLLNGRADQVFSVARLIKDPDSRQPLAVIIADADKNILAKITEDIRFNVNSTIVVLDQHRNVLYANHPLTEEQLTGLAEFENSDYYEGASYTGISRTIDTSDWRIVVFLSNEELMAKVRWIYIIAFLLSAGALIVTFGVYLYFSRGILTPFKRMNLVMNKVKKGDMTARFATRGKDEIDQLGSSLNNMVSQLDRLVTEEYKAKLAQKNAEYLALQSQIQPHFLYNTLTGFIGLNREGQTKKLDTAILSLSSMLRYILNDNQMSTVEEEFTFLHKYGLLQQLRFEDRLQVEIVWDKEIADIPIPKLLIQPIVENAIIHGVEPDVKQNVVTIAAKAVSEEAMLYVDISVIDNGVGLDTASLGAPGHIGLRNVRERLLMYNQNAAMDIVSSKNQGTRVDIRIPLGGNKT